MEVQAHVGLPMQRRKGAGGCVCGCMYSNSTEAGAYIQHEARPAGTSQHAPNSAASCAHGDAGQGRQQGQGGPGQDKSRKPQVGSPELKRALVTLSLMTFVSYVQSTRKRSEWHRRGRSGPSTRPEEVTPGVGQPP